MTENERRNKGNEIIKKFLKELERETEITVVFVHIDLRIPDGTFVQVNFHEDQGKLDEGKL